MRGRENMFSRIDIRERGEGDQREWTFSFKERKTDVPAIYYLPRVKQERILRDFLGHFKVGRQVML